MSEPTGYTKDGFYKSHKHLVYLQRCNLGIGRLRVVFEDSSSGIYAESGFSLACFLSTDLEQAKRMLVEIEKDKEKRYRQFRDHEELILSGNAMRLLRHKLHKECINIAVDCADIPYAFLNYEFVDIENDKIVTSPFGVEITE